MAVVKAKTLTTSLTGVGVPACKHQWSWQCIVVKLFWELYWQQQLKRVHT